MNQSNINILIDENEIRDALRPYRPDTNAFSTSVRTRIDAALNNVQNAKQTRSISSRDSQQSEWLRIAASFLPVHFLGRNTDPSIVPISFAAISLGKKLVVVLAFPFLCLFMIGLTILGMLRIRAAQHGQSAAGFEIQQANHMTLQWWKRYGWIAAIVFFCMMAAPLAGWTTPLMVAIVCSGFAAVSFVRTLASQKLVERSLIGGMCVAGLGLLGQASQSLSMISGTSRQVLDPNMVTGVLFAGALMINALVRPLAWTKTGDVQALYKYSRDCLVMSLAVNVCALGALAYYLATFVPLIAITVEVALAMLALGNLSRNVSSNLPRIAIRTMYTILLMAICTQSYWRGVTSSDIRNQVESSDIQQLRIWDQWADAAQWLSESGVGFNKQKVMQQFDLDLNQSSSLRPWMLTAAVRSGLISKSELPPYTNVQTDLEQLTAPQFLEQPLLDLQSEYFRIVGCDASGELTSSGRDVLTRRLMVNWNHLDSQEFVSLGRMKNALLLTELFNLLDPSNHLEQRTADVHRWLVGHQVAKPRLFQDSGGFMLYEQSYHCDRRATLSAISLMETYGAPAGLDAVQLRSYLRPNCLYDFQPYDYIPKTIARVKLNQIAGVPKLGILDYLQTELPLWLSMMLVFLLSYATLGSPVREEA